MDIEQLYEIYKSHPVITTDSRDCPADSIFIALKGGSFDGNKFAAAALEKGCAFAVIDEPECAVADDSGRIDPRYIVVDDCLRTFLQKVEHLSESDAKKWSTFPKSESKSDAPI